MSTKEVEEAIRASKAGAKKQARALLIQALKDDPRNEDAWLWLARIVDDAQQRRDCLEQVLKINPQNETVRLALAKQNQRAEKKPVPTAASKQGRNWLLTASGILLLIGLIGIGIFWLIREKRTEVVALDLGSVFSWGMIDEASLLEIGNQVRTRLEEEKRKQLAVNPDSYGEYVFWNNAELLKYAGYLQVRLPVEADDMAMVEVQELVLFYTFDGPTDIESARMDTMNVTVFAQVVNQETGELKIRKYEEDSAPFVFDCFVCPTYAFNQCSVLQGCYWVNLR